MVSRCIPLTLVVLAALWGCSKPKRTNPYDPANTPRNLTGNWVSVRVLDGSDTESSGLATLKQSGMRVTGDYYGFSTAGRLDGTIIEDRLVGRYWQQNKLSPPETYDDAEPGSRGDATFAVSEDNRTLEGIWAAEGGRTGDWKLCRVVGRWVGREPDADVSEITWNASERQYEARFERVGERMRIAGFAPGELIWTARLEEGRMPYRQKFKIMTNGVLTPEWRDGTVDLAASTGSVLVTTHGTYVWAGADK